MAMLSIRFDSEAERKLYERFKARALADGTSPHVRAHALIELYANGHMDQLLTFARQLAASECASAPDAAAWLKARGAL